MDTGEFGLADASRRSWNDYDGLSADDDWGGYDKPAPAPDPGPKEGSKVSGMTAAELRKLMDEVAADTKAKPVDRGADPDGPSLTSDRELALRQVQALESIAKSLLVIAENSKPLAQEVLRPRPIPSLPRPD